MSKGRKLGTGNVKVNGETLSYKNYRNAIISSLKHNGNNPMTGSQITNWAAERKLVEKKNAARKGSSHPIYKHLSDMMKEKDRVIDRKKNENGIYEYYLIKCDELYINGVLYERLHDGSYDEVGY